MIRRSPVGVSPKLTVAIGGTAINYESLMTISLDFQANQHDVCKITMAGVPAVLVTDYIGKSVYVKMETGSSYVSEFWGTVQHSAPVHETAAGTINHNLFQEVVFTCLGCSYAMRGSTTMVWKNHTLEDLARVFCNKYGFSLDVPDDPLIFDNLMQSAESDWQVLVRYCHNMGYSLTVHGTHMHIFDPFKAAGRAVSVHRLSSPLSTSVVAHPGQIVSFEGKFARLAADGVYIDSVATVHNDAGTVYDVHTSDIVDTPTPAVFANPMTVTSDNYMQAARMIKSEHRAMSDYSATALVLGAAGVLPGGIINLDKYNGTFDGLWYVDGVMHHVRSGSFLTELRLRKNKIDTLIDVSTSAFSAPPPPQFLGGQWTTTKRLVNVYS